MVSKEIIYCPGCGMPAEFSIHVDEHTPWHLHCRYCKIGIGATSQEEAAELLQKYYNPLTYMEFYDNEIKFLEVNGLTLIERE